MTSSSLFPDDLMMEYDLLQFMENADAPSTANSSTNSNTAFLNVDDLLANATIGLDFTDTVSVSTSTTHQQLQQILANKMTSSDANKPTNPAPTGRKEECEADALADEASLLLDDILLNGDDLLAHLEAEAAGLEPLDCPKKATGSPCPSACQTDDCVSSPCPSLASDGHCKSPTPAGHSFDELAGMARLDASSISPVCTPSQNNGFPLGSLVLTSSPSHDGSTESDETSSLDGATEDEADERVVAAHAPQIPTVVVEEEDEDEAMEDEDEDAVEHQQDLLAKEATYLAAQYDYLVSRAKSSRASARQSVRAKRRAREDQKQQDKAGDNTLLTQLVSQQQVYMDNFKAMLAFAPVNDIRMALMTPIETYIRLGRDFDERRRTILALREEKLDMTYKYIEEKARGINVDEPYQYSDVFERFGKYYSVHFAVSKYDGVEVGQVVKVVYDQMAGKDESIAAAMGCLTIRESYDQIKCNFLHQRIVSSLQWSEEFEEGLPEMESNSLFFCRFVGDTAVFATDYIDQDDLHPYLSKDRIRKDVSSGVVLTSHTDADGKRSVIMKKFLMAKFHMYPHNLSEKLTKILFNKMPCVSQKVTKLIDEKLLESRGAGSAPLSHCADAMAQQHQQQQETQAQAQTTPTHC